jgi:hypothetical protein
MTCQQYCPTGQQGCRRCLKVVRNLPLVARWSNQRNSQREESMDHADKREIYDDFMNSVNMQPSELEDWLESNESKSVGDSSSGGESIGHQSGRRIVEIKRTKKDDLTDDDYQHMQKVNGYVSRHLAQRPDGDVTETNWRYSLMNWGHDPIK